MQKFGWGQKGLFIMIILTKNEKGGGAVCRPSLMLYVVNSCDMTSRQRAVTAVFDISYDENGLR